MRNTALLYGALALIVCGGCASQMAVTRADARMAVAPLGKRRPHIADFLNMREIGVVRPSPDGQLVAMEVARPRAGEVAILHSDADRTDIYVVKLASGAVQRITDGRHTGSSSWSPMWSPDGDKLAFMTDDGKEHSLARAEVWDLRTGREVILGTQSIDIRVNWGNEDEAGAFVARRWGLWLDDNTLLTALLPAGLLADSMRFHAPHTPVRDYGQLWNRTADGKVAVTVWTAGRTVACGSTDTLVAIDIPTGRKKVLYRGAVRAANLSPHKKYLAVVVGVLGAKRAWDAGSDVWFDFTAYRVDLTVPTGLRVLDVQSGRDLGEVAGVRDLTTSSVRMFPTWSENDLALAVPSHTGRRRDVVYYVTIPNLRAAKFVARSALDAEILAQMLSKAPSRARPTVAKEHYAPSSVAETVAWHGTSSIRVVPGRVVNLIGGKVGVLLDGTFTVFDEWGRKYARVSGVGGELVYPDEAVAIERPSGTIAIEDGRGTVSRIDLNGQRPKSSVIGRVPTGATLNAVIDGDGIVFTEQTDDGTFVWYVQSGTRRLLYAVNRYLANIQVPREVLIAYPLGGTRAYARLWLPRGYRHGGKLPMIVVGYPAFYIRGIDKDPLDEFYKYPENLLVAAGYAVLQPTVPRRPSDSDPRFAPITYYGKAVVAGVRAAVRDGYADSRKIGYFGWSYGGYLGMALETRTTLFKAIAVVAPYANLVAMHDSLTGPLAELNECTPSEVLSWGIGQFESAGAVLDLGGPPWKELPRYITNSPYFALQHATTPLLMEKGEFDDDLPAIRGAFATLNRVGVPVQLAVYWGEDHMLQTRGNVRDGWVRVLDWFNRWIQPGFGFDEAPTGDRPRPGR